MLGARPFARGARTFSNLGRTGIQTAGAAHTGPAAPIC